MTPRGYTDARDKILIAASDLFYEQGYQATTIDQVIEQSGVSRPTVYSHFKTKEDLCVAYLNQRREQDVEKMTQAMRSKSSPKEKYLGVMKFVRQIMIDSHFRGCGYFNMISEFPDGNHPIVKEAMTYIDAFRDIIREGVQEFKKSSPKHRNLDVKRTAETYYILVCGAIMACQEYRQTWPLDRALSAIEDLIKN